MERYRRRGFAVELDSFCSDTDPKRNLSATRTEQCQYALPNPLPVDGSNLQSKGRSNWGIPSHTIGYFGYFGPQSCSDAPDFDAPDIEPIGGSAISVDQHALRPQDQHTDRGCQAAVARQFGPVCLGWTCIGQPIDSPDFNLLQRPSRDDDRSSFSDGSFVGHTPRWDRRTLVQAAQGRIGRAPGFRSRNEARAPRRCRAPLACFLRDVCWMAPGVGLGASPRPSDTRHASRASQERKRRIGNRGGNP